MPVDILGEKKKDSVGELWHFDELTRGENNTPVPWCFGNAFLL